MTRVSHLRVVQGAPIEGTPPPHDMLAEQAVISTILLDGRSIDGVDRILRAEHFYSEAHRRIFAASSELRRAGTLPDTVTVLSFLKDRDQLGAVGGTAYVLETLPATPAADRIETYARIVIDKWRVRQAIATCQRAAAMGYLDYGDPQAFIDAITKDIAALGRMGVAGNIERNAEALGRLLREAGASAVRGDEDVGPSLTTGLDAWDSLVGGMRPGQKHTVAAMPGVGKSIIGLQLAICTAARGVGAVVFSGEMTPDELRYRALAYGAGVDSRAIPEGRLSGEEWRHLHAWATTFAAYPFEIERSASMHVGNIRARTLGWVERMRVERGAALGLIVVDYVQRLAPAPEVLDRPRHEQIGHATQELKTLAQEVGIVVIELAQSKERDGDSRSGRPKPTFGCVADSSRIEKEADSVVHIWEKQGRPPPGRPRTVTLVSTKVRNGDTGERDVTLYPAFSRFEG